MNFEDLLFLRAGGPDMTMGTGATIMERVRTGSEWESKAEHLRALYVWTLGRKPDGYDVALELRIESETDEDGYVKRTVSYMVGPGERIRAHILIPAVDVGRPRPAVVTIHPTTLLGKEQTIGEDPHPEHFDYAYGLHLVRRGFVTISYDIDSANERLYPGCQSFGNGPFYEKFPQWSARGKDIHDVSRAIDVLALTPEVDIERVGCLGHSQGGGITTDAMVLEPRIKAGVNNCGDWPFRLSKNPFNRCRTGWWIGNPQLRPFAASGKEMPIDLHEKLALAAPRSVLMIVALDDFQWRRDEESATRPVFENLAENVRRVYRFYGAEDSFRMDLHVLGHSFHVEQRERAYAFLAERL